MDKDKVLVVGSGGREDALSVSIAKSDNVSHVFRAPGNAREGGKIRNVPIDGTKTENFRTLYDFVISENIGTVIVGPEGPLDNGIVDNFNHMGFTRIYGPTLSATRLESDKKFSLEIMNQLGIPHAESVACVTTEQAIKAIKERTTDDGIVIKARGLTGGKGVTVCDTREQALEEITLHAEKYGPEVLIAERLIGQEFSVTVLVDGDSVLPIEMSFQDHKQAYDNDEGPMTGGMGAYGPAPIASQEVVRYVANDMLTPMVQYMKEDDAKFIGFMYTGLMMTNKGPKILEVNVRFGDPECQPSMVMLKNSIYEPISLALEGKLDEAKFEFRPGAACCVVMASNGYPGNYEGVQGCVIKGLGHAERIDEVTIFHAGTKLNDHGEVVVAGSRVLGITGYSPNGLVEACDKAYQAVRTINIATSKFNRKEVFHFRQDIGNKALPMVGRKV